MLLEASRLRHATRPPARPSLWLELADEEGRVGLGEASPLPPFSPDDIASSERVLSAIHARLGPIDDHAPAAFAIERALDPLTATLAGAPAARFALETALLDLLGKRSGAAIAELLGGPRPYHEVPVNGLLIASPDPEGLPARAAALAEAGARAIKIKLRAADDAGFARELAALRAVRAILPLPFELRLDPNGAWSVEQACVRLAALAPIAPRFVEQPVAAELLHLLGPSAVPWAADESLAHPELVEALLGAPEETGCAAFVLKPAVLGGLLRARALAERAQARGIDVVVTHLFDGPIAMAAAAELALSLPRAPLPSGLDLHEGLAAFPPLPIPQLARRFWIKSHGRAGLGIDLPQEDPPWPRSAPL
jgi:o-succinylbenzoate synthase